MMYPSIRCYHLEAIIPEFSFFLLCKGCNVGKPGFKPWTNSFIVSCNNQDNFDFFFWLVYGLFQSGKFQTRQRGTAIPFINLNDVRDCIREVAPLIHSDWSRFRKILSHLDKLNKLKTSLSQQLVAMDRLQRYLLHKYFEEISNSLK